MIEIKQKQVLEVHNVLSFRGKIKSAELESIGKDMELKAKGAGAKKVGNPITATFGIEGDILDIELLMPLDREIESLNAYSFKEKFKLVNALVGVYKGNPIGLQKACDELNQYMIDNQMQPITVGYNVTEYVDPTDIGNTQISVYVGISPNIL